MKMKMSTNNFINSPTHGMASDRHKIYEVPTKYIYIYYMGNDELIKRILRMQGWWSTKVNLFTNKWIDMGIKHNHPYVGI